MKKEIRFETQQKVGKQYITRYTNTDRADVYQNLSNDLISKKIIGSSSVSRIERKSSCDGMQKITVTYSDGWRTVYEVESRF